ncbi:hypothetical protein IEO21_08191 [Rhodonia placenta]|uniref:Uncharacterized protein n=1 Tax=Rhodonia placenta TaxID=104341 RepID=A0A8H7NWW2_9APHY|nr:hypothetical protein IEO21_08191 [Postia placenta]
MAPTAAAGSGGGHAQRHTATVALRTRPIRTERGGRSTQLPTASASKQSSWAHALLCLRTRGSDHRRRALVAVSAGTRFGAGAGPRTLLCQRGQAGTLDGRASSIGVRTYDIHFEGAAPASDRCLARSGPCACETERSGLRWWRYRSLWIGACLEAGGGYSRSGCAIGCASCCAGAFRAQAGALRGGQARPRRDPEGQDERANGADNDAAWTHLGRRGSYDTRTRGQQAIDARRGGQKARAVRATHPTAPRDVHCSMRAGRGSVYCVAQRIIGSPMLGGRNTNGCGHDTDRLGPAARKKTNAIVVTVNMDGNGRWRLANPDAAIGLRPEIVRGGQSGG